MENASNALIIAGSILIAIIVLSMGVHIIITHSRVTDSYNQRQITTEVYKYNSYFTPFIGRTDITIQEIITLKNYTVQYCKKNNISSETKVFIGTDELTAAKANTERIKEDEPVISGSPVKVTFKYYKCEANGIEYNNDKGRVSKIIFTPIQIIKNPS